MIAIMLAASLMTQAAQVILPGQADLQIIAGSTATVCPDLSAFGAEFEARGPRQCVETTAEDVDRVALNYIAALRRDGWRMTGGGGPQHWIERPTSSDQCDHLDLTGLPGEILGRPADRAVLIFEYRSTRCMPVRQ